MKILCKECGLPLLGKSSQMFCSRSCGDTFRLKQIVLKGECSTCGRSYELTRGAVEGRTRRGRITGNLTICSDCCTSGPCNPNWKGGHKHWSLGRFGRDKDGLSWKVQRRLAWERDDFTCQHCGKKKNRKPDVHHIEPWMNSQSHALSNLICLCQSCHLKEEAKVQEKWGGQFFKRPVNEKKPKRQKVMVKEEPIQQVKKEFNFCNCGKVLRHALICNTCKRNQNKQLVKDLRMLGKLPHTISQEVGVSIRTVHYWLKN